jgi:hypothetical protein
VGAFWAEHAQGINANAIDLHLVVQERVSVLLAILRWAGIRKPSPGADICGATTAKRLGKHQSFVAKYEGGERRMDVVEFLAITAAMALILRH